MITAPCSRGRGTARAEDAQGTPTHSHISPSILVYEDCLEGDDDDSALLEARLLLLLYDSPA